jgi:acetoin utilization protein AcuB
MRVAEVMTKNVKTVPPAMAATEAYELMRRGRIHHLVAMTGSEVAGVLSDRDLGRVTASLRADSSVEDLMTTSVVTAAPTTTVRQIANMMRGRTIGCVPVVDGKRLVGIVTVSDLLELLGRGIDRPAKPARRGLNHRVPHRKGKSDFGVW